MKTFVIMVSKRFPVNHPRKGQRTGFKSKIKSKEKIHTIRDNYRYWYRIANEVNSGRGILSVREWSGDPYRSKQVEIFRRKKIGIQPITILKNATGVIIKSRSLSETEIINLADNDGLSIIDFKNWFKNSIPVGAIIHLTDFRYK